MKILYIEDDSEYQFVVAEALKAKGYDTTVASSATEAIQCFKTDQYDLVISDLTLEGDIDGLQLTYLLRQMNPSVKIIILTGSNDELDEVRGLDLQVNEFIHKPIKIQVFLKRIEIVLNKEEAVSESDIECLAENLFIERKSRRVYKNHQLISLTSLEYSLLVYLILNRNRVLTRDELLEKVWRLRSGGCDARTVDTHIRKLRAKLDLTSIASIRSVGYEWFE